MIYTENKLKPFATLFCILKLPGIDVVTANNIAFQNEEKNVLGIIKRLHFSPTACALKATMKGTLLMREMFLLPRSLVFQHFRKRAYDSTRLIQ